MLVAFAVVPAESAADYIWFIKNMKHSAQLNTWLNENCMRLFYNSYYHLYLDVGLVLITDRGKGLKKAIAMEFPNACMRHCARHLLGNIPGQSFEDSSLFWKAVYPYDKYGFDIDMEDLKSVRPEAFNRLDIPIYHIPVCIVHFY